MNYREDKYIVKTREEYEALKVRGVDVLFWDNGLELEHGLRVSIQQEVFGRGNHQRNNQKFYRYVWGHKRDHWCEECHRPLPEYNAAFVSHIQSRGAHPETAYDCRNVNILCPLCHERWENGDRMNMRIWNKNKSIIKQLRSEYTD